MLRIPNTCHVQIDQSPARVHRPVLDGSEALVEVMKAIRIFAILVEPWCLLEPFTWFEL
jgi:hypothetical protein